MAILPTYPGVYIQEIPSGVRTISGVSTSTTLFIGRAVRGPLNKPVLCLGLGDFERAFSVDPAQSELHYSVRLFFENGGSQCYVMRIANNAQSAKLKIRNEDGTSDALEVTAKEAGLLGNMIRMGVTYRGLLPESTFDLEVFQWLTNSQGVMNPQRREVHKGLSMDPSSPRYAIDVVNTNSQLIELKDPEQASLTAGTSLSGRPVGNGPSWKSNWANILGSTATTNKFRISVNRQPFVEVDLQSIVVADQATLNDLETAIQNNIEAAVGGGLTVPVSTVTGPNSGPNPGEATVQLQIAFATGDVLIEPAPTNDLTVPLMLGTAQGGIEMSRYAARRPAPTGTVYKLANLVSSFAQLVQTPADLSSLQINSTPLPNPGIALNLATANATTYPDPRLFRDGYTSSQTQNSDGLREKWGIIATAINNTRTQDPSFGWQAEVWGSRLAVFPTTGNDNSQATLTTGGAASSIGGDFLTNTRYYSLGTGTGTYQTGAVSGQDGSAPLLGDYQNAYTIAEQDIDLFNLLVLPRDHGHSSQQRKELLGPASTFCKQSRAFLLIDPPKSWSDVQSAIHPNTGVNQLRIGLAKDHSAIFYPQLVISEKGSNKKVGPSGAIAGLMARIDSSRGVWKAPAGTEANLRGVTGLEYRLTDRENGVLNPKAINALRVFPNGIVNWGARTMDGDDDFGSEYKYIPIRRLALYLEESLYRGLKWVVFEPNDEPLWSQIRLNVETFMHDLFRQGAFQGKTPQQAFFVRCDAETTPQSDRDRGIVNVVVGFAPLKPAEFVILSLQQIAGQIAL